MGRIKVLSVVLLFTFLAVAVKFPSVARAQQPTGTIQGVVKDSSGAVVPGSTVTVTNVNTGQTRTTVTHGDGTYNIPSLPVGTYDVKAEHAGFQTQTHTGFILNVASTVVANFTLAVGSTQQTVTVTGAAPVVNTTTSSLGGLVNSQSISNLPLNGRNYIDLTLLQPGVTQLKAIGSAAGLAGTWFSSNGAPTISNYFTLDGAPAGTQMGGTTASYAGTTLGIDGIAEYRVITNTFSAQYGMTMGSQVVMVSKGGTNHFHGDVYDYLRNSSLDAANYFDTRAGSGGHRLPEFRRNDFGGSFGGPIRKNKTFFYAVYEGLRQTAGFTPFDTVLPAECHNLVANGNNYAFKTAADATACSPNLTGSSVVPGVVKPLIDLYPSPNLPNDQFTFSSSDHTTEDFGQMRVDQTFSSTDSFFVRYTIDNGEQTGANVGDATATSGVAFPQFRALGRSRNQYLSLVETHIFSPTLLNTARISYSRTHLLNENQIDPSVSKISFLPGLPMGTLNITNISSIGGSASAGPPPAFHLQNIYTFSDDINFTHGRNSLMFGTLIERYGQGVQSAFNLTGTVTFPSVSQFMLGYPETYASVSPGGDLNRYWMYTAFGFYVEDDVRATSRLTLNLGLRYEFVTLPRELNAKESRFLDIHDPNQTWSFGPIVANHSRLNFDPRLGFAWDVFGNGKTAIRGGTGLYDDIGNMGEYLDQQELGIPPFSSNSSVNFGATNSTTLLTLPIVYPSGSVGTSLHTVSYNYYQARMLQYNLTVEQQLNKSTALSVSYVGSRGYNLDSPTWNINYAIPTTVVNGVDYYNAGNVTGCLNKTGAASCRVNPDWTGILYQTRDGRSWYNSLQVLLTRRLARGLQFQAAYTDAQALDNATGALFGAECSNAGMDHGSFPQDRIKDKGPTCFDVRNNFRLSLLYYFPSLHANGILSKLTNGWWMGNIVSMQSGYAFTPILASQRDSAGQFDKAQVGTASVAPGQTVGGFTNNTSTTFIPYNKNKVIEGTPKQWFNPAMFTLAPGITCTGVTNMCMTVGNAPRGLLRGPGLATWDFSLVKDTKLGFLGEAGNLEFRAEFFNFLNRPNFAMPNGVVFRGNTGSKASINPYSESPLGTAGQIIQTSTSSRQIQFALKLLF